MFTRLKRESRNFRAISIIEFPDKITTMTYVTDDLISVSNSVTQLSNFILREVTLNSYSRGHFE